MVKHESTIHGAGQNPARPFPLACVLDQRAKNSFYPLEEDGGKEEMWERREEEEGVLQSCACFTKLTQLLSGHLWKYFAIPCCRR